MDDIADQFELVGDPDALPDAFFDALARWLLSIREEDTLETEAKEDAA